MLLQIDTLFTDKEEGRACSVWGENSTVLTGTNRRILGEVRINSQVPVGVALQTIFALFCTFWMRTYVQE